MQRPSVGRIVHVIENVEAMNKPCLAGIVTAVNDDGTIKVTVFKPDFINLTAFNAVKELQIGDELKADSNVTSAWHWPERVS